MYDTISLTTYTDSHGTARQEFLFPPTFATRHSSLNMSAMPTTRIPTVCFYWVKVTDFRQKGRKMTGYMVEKQISHLTVTQKALKHTGAFYSQGLTRVSAEVLRCPESPSELCRQQFSSVPASAEQRPSPRCVPTESNCSALVGVQRTPQCQRQPSTLTQRHTRTPTPRHADTPAHSPCRSGCTGQPLAGHLSAQGLLKASARVQAGRSPGRLPTEGLPGPPVRRRSLRRRHSPRHAALP